jgi:hypothetical protein
VGVAVRRILVEEKLVEARPLEKVGFIRSMSFR